MSLIVYCSRHSEYGQKLEKTPKGACDMCDLFFILKCRDNKYTEGSEDFPAFRKRLRDSGVADACEELPRNVKREYRDKKRFLKTVFKENAFSESFSDKSRHTY